MRENENLTKLGSAKTTYSMDYDPSVLESFNNKHPPKRLLCQVQLPWIYQSLPNHRSTWLCQYHHLLCTRSKACGEQVIEVISIFLQKSRRLPRRCGQYYYEGLNSIDGSKVHWGMGEISPPWRTLHWSILQLWKEGHDLGKGRNWPPSPAWPLPWESGQSINYW